MEFSISPSRSVCSTVPVLVEQDDLFGDAVNVAARMVSLAKADQIITTRETALCLPQDLEQMTRSLGRSRVRGKQEEIEIVEVIWQEASSLTQVISIDQHEELRSHACSHAWSSCYRGVNVRGDARLADLHHWSRGEEQPGARS
jgi:hypothetical protein